VILDSAWWGPIDDLDSSIPITPSIWWDELSIDPPPDADRQGLYFIPCQRVTGVW